MGSRRKAREKALQILFQLDFGGSDIDAICRDYWSKNRSGEKVREFADELVRGTYANLERIDKHMSATLEHWSMERLASVDRAILRCAIFELLYMPEIPPKVTINEAVEIAKKYGAGDSSKFINGVLDKIREEVDESTAAPQPSPAEDATE